MKEELNPVSKARLITETLTPDVFLQNLLLEIITHNLTSEQINNIYKNKKEKKYENS